MKGNATDPACQDSRVAKGHKIKPEKPKWVAGHFGVDWFGIFKI